MYGPPAPTRRVADPRCRLQGVAKKLDFIESVTVALGGGELILDNDRLPGGSGDGNGKGREETDSS